MQVNPGTWYVVTTDSSCTVTDANGKTLCTAVAGTQKPFLATTMEVTLSDEGATVTKSTFNAALALLGQSGEGGNTSPSVPAGSVKVDYLESTGQQYIKTGFYPDQDSGIRTVHQQVAAGNYRVAGCGQSGSTTTNCLMAYSRNSAAGSAYGFYKWQSVDSRTSGWDEVQTGIVNYLDGGSDSTSLKGASFTVGAFAIDWDEQFSSLYEFYLFAFNRDGSLYGSYSFRGKIFEAQLTQGEVVAREYVPYVSKDGVPFMFETKLGRVLTNSGSGAFRVGISTLSQLNSILNNLPDRSGDAEPSQLLVRLAPELQTEEVSNKIANISNLKNWSFVEP